MTKSPLKFSCHDCDCPAKPVGGQVQQRAKLRFSDFAGKWLDAPWEKSTRQSCRAPCFVCSGAIWNTHWDDLQAMIDTSGILQFLAQGSAWTEVGDKMRAQVLINLWKMKRNHVLHQSSSIRIHVAIHEATNISIWFKMRKHGSNESPHSCALVRVQNDHAHRGNACSRFAFSSLWCDVTWNRETNISVWP